MKAYPVQLLCSVMGVSRSGFYLYVKRKKRRDKDRFALAAAVKALFAESRGTYGSRRLVWALRKMGYKVGRCRVRTLMRRYGLKAAPAKRFRRTTDSDHRMPVMPNVLNRSFSVKAPDRVWAGDITYLWTREGWLYLAALIDLHSRKVVGWALDRRLTSGLALEAFRMAAGRRRPAPGLIHHTDRGSQYAGRAYQQELARHGMVCSMSRKGDCWDNAVAERFFRSLKTECTNRRLYRSRDEARRDVVDYIETFYNSRRLHSYLGYMSPNQFEALAT